MLSALRKFLYPETENVKNKCAEVDAAVKALKNTVKENEKTIEIFLRKPNPFNKLAVRMSKDDV